MIPLFQAKFLDCMRRLYPTGVGSSSQVVDLARTFSMGWVEALLAAGLNDQADQQLEEFVFLTDEHWRPDAGWRWW